MLKQFQIRRNIYYIVLIYSHYLYITSCFLHLTRYNFAKLEASWGPGFHLAQYI